MVTVIRQKQFLLNCTLNSIKNGRKKISFQIYKMMIILLSINSTQTIRYYSYLIDIIHNKQSNKFSWHLFWADIYTNKKKENVYDNY